MWRLRIWSLIVATVFLGAAAQAQDLFDITAPGDPIIGIPDDGDWPGAETPDLAIDDVVADAGAAGLRVRLDGAQALIELSEVLDRNPPNKAPRKSLGPLLFCVPDPETGGEIEIDIGREIPVTPMVKAAMRGVEGMLAVEEV